jgi:type II secretory pathway component PulC
LRGFRVFPNGNRVASFDKSGLRGGDLLVAVNGASMLDLDRQTGKEILNGLSTPGTVTVTIERNGERRDVTLNALEDASPAE